MPRMGPLVHISWVSDIFLTFAPYLHLEKQEVHSTFQFRLKCVLKKGVGGKGLFGPGIFTALFKNTMDPEL